MKHHNIRIPKERPLMSLMSLKNKNMSSLTLITGCMFANKSTMLLGRIRHAVLLYGEAAIFCASYRGDVRYQSKKSESNANHAIISHDLQSHPCLSITRLEELFDSPLYAGAKAVFLEEGQFFTGLMEFAKRIVETDGKQLTIVGLSTTHLREPFHEMCDLVAIADEVIKLSAICMRCRDGTPAIFNRRLRKNQEDAQDQDSLIGGAESYESVCRFHWLSLSA